MSEKRIHELKNKQRSYERRYGGGRPHFEIGPVTYSILGMIVVTAMAMLYLSQANKLATQGYVLNDLRQRQEEIKSENERLMVEVTRLQSLNESAAAAPQKSGMIATGAVTYVPIVAGAVAKR